MLRFCGEFGIERCDPSTGGWTQTATFLRSDLAVGAEPPAGGQSLLEDGAESQTLALHVDGLKSTQSQVDLGRHLDMRRRIARSLKYRAGRVDATTYFVTARKGTLRNPTQS